jgi:hypothetical protein
MDYIDGWELWELVYIRHYFHLRKVAVAVVVEAVDKYLLVERIDMPNIVHTDGRYVVALMKIANSPTDYHMETNTCLVDCVHNMN